MVDNSSCLSSRSFVAREMTMEREERWLGICHEHKHTLPPPPSDPSDNSGVVLLRLATLEAEVLAMVRYYTS